jgi:hypothetical protein
MPSLLNSRPRLRPAALLLGAVLAAFGTAALPGAAQANSHQVSIIQDNIDLSNPGGAMGEFRMLGASTVRLIVPWGLIAPAYSSHKKPNFDATDPGAYPTGSWTRYDDVVRAAQSDGLNVDLTVTGGSPLWGENLSGIPPQGKNPQWAWKPNAKDFGQFVQAVGKRYSGSYIPTGESTPLPRVHFWAIYNEPNFGEDLGPQAIDGSHVSVGPLEFRSLLNQGWKALHETGHGHDTIIFGEFAARGITIYGHRGNPAGYPGWYGQTKPLIFIRTLYCLDNNYHELRGRLARAEGCPTNAAGSRKFRRDNPALFNASGVSDHPYALKGSPVRDGLNDPNFAAFPALGKFGREFDRVTAVYGAHPHFPIYNTEYGYITHPPQPRSKAVSQATAAWYINWAEYLSYKNPRIRSYTQYLLYDPPPSAKLYNGFASGLLTYTGRPKATYYAYRMPLYMPRTNVSKRRSVEVWGGVRPAPFATLDGFGPQTVTIQEKVGKGSWSTIGTAKTGSGGYFDVHLKFKSSGRVRTQWTYPNEPLLPPGFASHSITSRSFPVRVH